jgi:hypothetical protein
MEGDAVDKISTIRNEDGYCQDVISLYQYPEL